MEEKRHELKNFLTGYYHILVKTLGDYKLSKNDELIAKASVYLSGLRARFDNGISESEINQEIDTFFGEFEKVVRKYDSDLIRDDFNKILYDTKKDLEELNFFEKHAKKIETIQKIISKNKSKSILIKPEPKTGKIIVEPIEEPIEEWKYIIKFKVLDKNGKPVKNASVLIDDSEVIETENTNNEGELDIGLKKGKYKITIKHKNSNLIKKIEINKDDDITFELDSKEKKTNHECPCCHRTGDNFLFCKICKTYYCPYHISVKKHDCKKEAYPKDNPTKETNNQKTCENCGQELKKVGKYYRCKDCDTYCGNCGCLVKENAKDCPECGERFDENDKPRPKPTKISKLLIVEIVLIILILGITGYQLYSKYQLANISNDNISIFRNNTENISINTVQKEEVRFDSLIQEIIETDKYDNKKVSIIGKVEFQNDINYKGYIVDKQGYKILFKGPNRGFNEAKIYNFTGIINGTSPKYLVIRQSIDEVS